MQDLTPRLAEALLGRPPQALFDFFADHGEAFR